MASKSKFQCALCQHVFASSEERPNCPQGCHYPYERPTARNDYVSTVPYQPPEDPNAAKFRSAAPKRKSKAKGKAKDTAPKPEWPKHIKFSFGNYVLSDKTEVKGKKAAFAAQAKLDASAGNSTTNSQPGENEDNPPKNEEESATGADNSHEQEGGPPHPEENNSEKGLTNENQP